jgi:hydrogenase maturation protease
VQATERLAQDPGLPPHVEVVSGGTDLLRYAAMVEGRARVVLIDAIEDGAPPGTVSILELTGLEKRQDHAHHLSVAEAAGLLRLTTSAKFTLIGISIGSAEFRGRLSREVEAAVPEIVDRVIAEV